MDYYQFIIKIVKKAGKILLKARESGFDINIKDNNPRNIVTNIDKKISKFISQEIIKRFPDHGIYSEEAQELKSDTIYKWTIDPIDGTANFSRGIPHYSIALGLLKNEIPFAGAIYNPATNELFSFLKGNGAFCNKKLLQVSEITELNKSHVFLHAGRNPELQTWGGESYRRLLKNANKTSNLASSSLDICFVAAGRIEAAVYGTLSMLDIAPAIGILSETGGIATDKDKQTINFSENHQKIYIANNKTILYDLINLLEK